jgi:hypothetical protein
MELTQEKAHELFDYKEGVLYWKPKILSRNRPSVKAGKKVGADNGNGYEKVRIEKKSYYIHQLVYLMQYGYIPSMIDHIDGNRKNNSIVNLREVNSYQNICNQKIREDNTSGFKGVHFNKQKKKWQAKLWVHGKQIARLFESKDLAIEFMGLFREMAHGQFARHF